MIYHMCQADELQETKLHGFCQPSGYRKDGFIHFSKKEQICATAERFYKGAQDLVLMEVDETRFPERIIFEKDERTQQVFPHLYALLPLSEIIRIIPFPPNADGSFSIPVGL